MKKTVFIMKRISKCILTILFVSFMTVACDDMNSIIQDDLDKGEAIYPGKAAGLTAVPGIKRAWLYWQLNPDTRVTKTVITWTIGGKTNMKEKAAPAGSGVRLDSTEITGLDEGLYTFSAYTVDKDGNRSITISSVPVNVFGDIYVGSLSARGIAKTEMLAGGNLQITWIDAPTDMLYSIVKYTSYSDNPNGVETTVDTVFNDATTTTLPALKRLNPFSVTSAYRIGLDTDTVVGNYYPTVIEKELLAASGFTELTDDAAAKIKKLSFPLTLEGWTLKDLYYFPNLEELDLTPGTSALPKSKYTRYYVNTTLGDTTTVEAEVGGGAWPYYASGFMSDNDRNIIKDLLASGQLKKIKYTRNSYPRLDADLEPYAAKVERTPTAPLSDDAIMIPPSLLATYNLQENGRGVIAVDHNADGSNVPAEIAAKFSGELKNVYKVTVNGVQNMLSFSLPEGVQFGFVPYGKLQFDVYIETTDPEYTWMKPVADSKYGVYNTIHLYRRNKFEAFPESSPQYNYINDGPWNNGTYVFGDAELGTWKSTGPWDLTPVPQQHIRVIILRLGNGDTGIPNAKNGQITYYIANLRWSK
jgi:hypothetical protein